MILALLVRVLDEQHIIDKSHKSLAYAIVLFPVVTVSSKSCEMIGDFTLCIEFLFEPIFAVSFRYEVAVTAFFGPLSEEII